MKLFRKINIFFPSHECTMIYFSLIVKLLRCFFPLFGVTLGGATGPSLYLGITTGGTNGTTWHAGNLIQIGDVRDKCPAHCTIARVPFLFIRYHDQQSC